MNTTAVYLNKTRASKRVDVSAILINYLLLPLWKFIKPYGVYALKKGGDLFEFLFVEITLPMLYIGMVSGLCFCLIGVCLEIIGYPVFETLF